MYALALIVVAATYFGLANLSLTVASIHSSVIPIWVPAGLAFAAVLLCGIRVWPAIFAAAYVAGVPTDLADASATDSIPMSLVVAVGSTLAPVVGGYLVSIWCGGRNTFDTPVRVAKFALVVLATTTISATAGIGGLSLAGHLEWTGIIAAWTTWWLRDAAGVLAVAPVVVLWACGDFRPFNLNAVLASATILAAAGVVGIIAFSPLIEQTGFRSALGFLAVVPLLWAALRCGPRDTATTALILSGFAAWGVLAGSGPFLAASFNESFLLFVMFTIGVSIAGLAVSADVTSRRRLEGKLRQQEQILRTMFSQAIVGIAQIDMAGRFSLVNNRLCEIVRRPAPQLLQMRIEDLAVPEDAPYLRDLLQQAVQSGEGFAIEFRHVLSDGSRLWLRTSVSATTDQSGAVRHLMGVVEDVTARRKTEEGLQRAHDDMRKAAQERAARLTKATELLNTEVEQRKRIEAALQHDIAERRKTQEALMESEWRFRMVIQGVTDYAIFMLDKDGHITNWNMGAQRIHQYTATEIIGEHFGRFYSEEEQQRGEPARALQVAAYEGKCAVEGWRVRRDKSLFWANVVIEAVRDEVGTLAGFVKITRDITERREAQASLERAQEQLAQSQKMEALGQLTGSIAHDFNNLLMIVSGHAQLLRRRLTDPKHLQAIDAVHSAANRGESLTRQLLAFSRRQPLNPVVTDLKERVEAVHEMLVGSLRGNVQLKCDIAADVWPVEVDIAELELALVNVAVNARDAMPGGGFITLSARNVALKKSDGIDQLEGDFVALAMTDTGVGIAPDVLPRILRAVLHDQGARQRHRSWAGPGLRLFPSIGRNRRCHQRGRQRHGDHHLSAAPARGAGQGCGGPSHAADRAGAGDGSCRRGQRRGRRRHGVPHRAAWLSDLARGKRHRCAEQATTRGQDRPGPQRRRHARRNERYRARSGNPQPLSKDSGSSHQRVQRRRAVGAVEVRDIAQAVPVADSGKVRAGGPGAGGRAGRRRSRPAILTMARFDRTRVSHSNP